MPDANDRIVALLEELVALQKTANERQREALQMTERHQADARERTGQALALQTTAVARQRFVVRVWIGVLVFVFALIAGLLAALSHYLH